MSLDPPRNWSDMAVPGPVRLVRMAVSTSLSQGLLGFCLPQRFGITVTMRRRSRLVDPASRAGQPDKYCEHYEHDYRGHHLHRESRLQRSPDSCFLVPPIAIRLPTPISILAKERCDDVFCFGIPWLAERPAILFWVSIYGLGVDQMDSEIEFRVNVWTAIKNE